MNDRLLLDTHIVLWLDSGAARLHASTRRLIDECRRGGGSILVSAITAWEIALLVDLGRIELDLPVEAWFTRFCDRPGVAALPLSHVAAIRAYQLHQFAHRDPADRLLIATAIEQNVPLVTYDERIVAFDKRYGRRYGFAVNAGSAASR